VASRFDRITIVAREGRAVLAPRWHFDVVVDLATIAREAVEGLPSRPDAGTHLHPGERLVELRDTDTGVWHVVTCGYAYIANLDRRFVTPVPAGEDVDTFVQHLRFPLAALMRCRVGATLEWDIEAAGHIMTRVETVQSIARLDDWDFN
jgi:hypothetical protein